MTEKNGIISIEDNGEGLSKKNLLFGSTDKDGTQIGMFGEGLKMASLVLARNNRALKVVTKGFCYEAVIERDTQFNADVLVVYLSNSRKRKGTTITFKGTEKELDSAKEHFLSLNPLFKEMDKAGIYSPGGHVFINGMFVQKVNSVFSYNFTKKTLLNRDRKSIDVDDLRDNARKALERMTDKKAIEAFLRNKSSYALEYQMHISIPVKHQAIWKSVIDKVFPKSCFAIGTEYDGVAKDRGFNLLINLPSTLANVLLQCGVKTADKVVNLCGDEGIVQKKVDPNSLSTKGKRRWNKAMKLFEKLYGTRFRNKFEIIETFKDGVETDSIWGLYIPATDKIYILKNLIESNKHSFDTLMGVIIHEQVHRMTQAHDRTREFEMGLSMELGRIASLYFKSVK